MREQTENKKIKMEDKLLCVIVNSQTTQNRKKKWREAVSRSKGDQKGILTVFMSKDLPGGKAGVSLVRDHKLAKQRQGLKK